MTAKIEIENVGPIRYLALDMPPDDGGVYVLKGDNGFGKTTAVKCIQALLGQKVHLTPTDLAPKGSIQGLGAKVSVTSQIRKTGFADAKMLEENFDLMSLIEPPYKDEEARNRTRIKALVQLVGNRRLSLDDFASLDTTYRLPETFGQHAPVEDLNSIEDGLELCKKVKQAYEKQAREYESSADRYEGIARDSRVKAGPFVTHETPDVDVAGLSQSLEKAIGVCHTLKGQEDQAIKRLQENAEASDRLGAHRSNVEAMRLTIDGTTYTADSTDLIEELIHSKAADVTQINEEIADLQRKIAELMAAAKTYESQRQEAVKFATAVTVAHQRTRELEAAIKSPIDRPKYDDVLAAETERDAIRAKLHDAQEEQAKVDAAKKAKKASDDAVECRNIAERYRLAAGDVFRVISEALPKGELRVENGTLVAFYPKRNRLVPFDELSDGERTAVAVRYAAEGIGANGVLPLKQEAWQGLNSQKRAMLAQAARDNKLWIITAELAECALHGEAYPVATTQQAVTV